MKSEKAILADGHHRGESKECERNLVYLDLMKHGAVLVRHGNLVSGKNQDFCNIRKRITADL